MTNKTINLGEYMIIIVYNDINGDLDVKVLDEGGELIESINIKDDDEGDDTMDFNLN